MQPINIKTIRVVFLLAFSLLFIACKKSPPEPAELYDAYRSSVALIQTSYYFITTLDNGFEFYYTLDKNDPVFHDTEEEAISNAGVMFGTGFFISPQGELVTNRHVVYPNIDTRLIEDDINEYLDLIKERVEAKIIETENEKAKIAEFYNSYYSSLDYESKVTLQDNYSTKQKDILELKQGLETLDFDPNDTKTEMKRIFLGIAYDDTHVTSSQDFDECVALRKSEVEEVDLAIIQLKNKSTPAHVTKFFSLTTPFENQLKLNDPVYMIGFNHGLALANTGNGIKSQFTQGTITQDPDQDRLLYSIPTLPGSSGSPILDEWGNLVAVNFAKTQDYQSFSFGIPVAALIAFHNGENLSTTEESYVERRSERPSVREVTKEVVKEIDFSDRIRDFADAEEERDFDLIYSFFSPSPSRYYDIDNPTYTKLKNRYEYLWNITSNAKNNIKEITKINDYVYDMKTLFTYFNKRKQKELEVQSTVRFMFDKEGKMVEIYALE